MPSWAEWRRRFRTIKFDRDLIGFIGVPLVVGLIIILIMLFVVFYATPVNVPPPKT